MQTYQLSQFLGEQGLWCDPRIPGLDPFTEPVDVYLASEVDARIAELEKALREILGAATVTPTTVTQKACEVPREILGRARNALMER